MRIFGGLRPRYSLMLDIGSLINGAGFGGINTVGVFFAEHPASKVLYLYRTYAPKTGRVAKEHVNALLEGEPGIPFAVGGAGSEDNWRSEFAVAGLPVREPEIRDVEVGINRVYGAIARDEIMVMDDLAEYLDEVQAYSRETDDAGNVSEKIQDKDEAHFCDATRYVIGFIRKGTPAWHWEPREDAKSEYAKMVEKGIFISKDL